MLLFLLCISFVPFNTNEGKGYQPKHSDNTKNTKSLTSGYHHIKIIDNSILSEFPEMFNTDSMENSNWFTRYLTDEQIKQLILSNKTILYPIHKSYKENIQLKGKNRFLVSCSQSFIKKIDHSLIIDIKFVSNDLYSITTPYSNIKKLTKLLINSPDVLSFSELPSIKLLNRWAKGFVQNGDNSILFNGNTYVGNNSLNSLGYKGENQVATIEDSGVDTTLRYFKDNSIDAPINKVNLNHRKIVKYKTLSKTDHADYSGHGTHCAGSIVGENIDDSDFFNAYNGGAPKAKLFVVDLEDSHGDMYIDTDFSNTIADMNTLGSFVSSNSWGLDSESNQVKYQYDVASYNNPSILWVFAAGNSYGFGTVLTPASCKNLLTVGALDTLYNNNLEKSSNTQFDIIVENQTNQVIKPSVFFVNDEYDSLMASNILPKAINANNKTAVIYEAGTSSYSDAAVFSSDCNQAVDAINRGATVILASSILSCPNQNINNAIGVIIPNSASFDSKILGRRISLVPKVTSPQNPPTMKVARFSSKGPSFYGSVKPEVVAPGSDIISADNGHYNSVQYMSGTSMACPTAAGSMIILREYAMDKFGITKPTSNLLKALVVCGAEKPNKPEMPDNEWGFGMLNIGNVVENISGNKVLIQNEISITFGKTLSFDLNVFDATRPLSIAMAYIDFPTAAESRISLVVDLDLFVVSPKGKLLHPLGNSEDQYSTVERIYVQPANIEIGTYHVYVKASKPGASTSSTSIPFSLVARGSIDSFTPTPSSSKLLDNSTNSPWTNVCSDPSFATADGCNCNDAKTGLFCQQEVINLPIDSDQVYRIPPMETLYLKGVLNGMNENFNLNLYQQTTPHNYFNVHSNPSNKPDKVLNYAYMNKFNTTKESLTGGPANFPSNSPVYFAISNFGSHEGVITLSLTIDMPPEYGGANYVPRGVNAISTAGTVVAIIIVILFVVAIIFAIVFCTRNKRKRKNKRRNSSEDHPATVVDETNNNGGGTANMSVPPECNGSYVPPSYPSGYNNTYPYPSPNYPPQNGQQVPPNAYSPSPAPTPYINAPIVEPQPVPNAGYNSNTNTNQGQPAINPYDPANFPTVNANNNANKPSYYPPYADPNDDK